MEAGLEYQDYPDTLRNSRRRDRTHYTW